MGCGRLASAASAWAVASLASRSSAWRDENDSADEAIAEGVGRGPAALDLAPAQDEHALRRLTTSVCGVLRSTPPLTVSATELDAALAIVGEALREEAGRNS